MKQALRFMRRPLVAFVLAMSVITVAKADGPVTLNIHHSDGTKTSIQLYTRPRVTFEGDRVVFTSPVAQFSYNAQDVLRFTYSGVVTPDKVTSPESQELFRQRGEQVLFDAQVKASDIQLFSEDGRRLPVSLTSANGRSSFSLASFPAGVYVLSVNGRTTKIVKR